MFMIEVWPCTSRRVGMSFSPRGKRCPPGGGLDGARTPSSKARKCPACGRAMKKNGRTGKGTQRWRCRACRLSSTMPQRGRRRARTLEEFLSWLPGRRPRRRRNPRATRAPCASGSHGAGQSGRASPAGREAPHGHGRRHVHGPRLAPDHRHRRRKRRSPRLPVVRARGAAPLLPAVGETLPRGEALRLSRAGACRRWAGGAHHEPAGGRRQLGRQERVAQPADCPRSTCSARANGCAT